MAKFLKILGFSYASDAMAMEAAMSALPGPTVTVAQSDGVAAFAQHDRRHGAGRPQSRDTLLSSLHSVQRRLEAACQLGPFVAADAANCRCRADSLAPLLSGAATAITDALLKYGTYHQWDVVLRWRPEPVLAAQRDALAAAGGGDQNRLAEAVELALVRDRRNREFALHECLAAVSLACKPAGHGETETGVTVLLPAGGERAVETALALLPEAVTAGASADLRGPLPPLSFAPVRIEQAAPNDVARAWQCLSLKERIDEAGLRSQWRSLAARLHPDHGAPDGAPLAAAGSAFRLLRGLLLDGGVQRDWTLAALQERALPRLVMDFPDTAQ